MLDATNYVEFSNLKKFETNEEINSSAGAVPTPL
jgi:hypothetical protein